MSDSRHVAIVGGSIAGLATALALAQAGHRVTIVERDEPALPVSKEETFEAWERRGSPQVRQSHAFLARLVRLLSDRAPELLRALYAQGAEPMRFPEFVGAVMPHAEFLPEDDEITLLACRRLTFEFVLRRHVESLSNVTLRRGLRVHGLIAESGRVPRVRGVRLGDRTRETEMLRADLVVDASGRRSRLPHWLGEHGARPMRIDSESCGIFYSSRFYALADGAAMPNLEGPMGADLGFLKYGIFPGDSRTFSITLAANPADEPFRALFRRPAFEALAATLPATQAWVDPSVARPISGILPMANLNNVRRYLVDDAGPIALGIAAVGDALIHTNPIVGRGCTLAFVNAFELADAFDAHAAEPEAFARDLDARVVREIVPWYEGVRSQDRDSRHVSDALRRGDDPYRVNRPDGTVDPQGYMRSLVRDGLLPSLREDVAVMRAFMRIFNLLDPPADLMENPAVFGKVLQVYQARSQRTSGPVGPTRDEVVAQLAALAA